jgi:hypothetical protein
MNRGMEEKGIVLRELSCRTAAELSVPKLWWQSGRRRSRPAAAEALAAVQQLRRCTPGAALPPKLSGCCSGCTPGAELPPKFRRLSGGGSSAVVRQLSSGSTVPFSSMYPPPDGRRSICDSPATPAGVARHQSGRKRDCTTGAELPGVVCERLTRTCVASERTLHFFTSVSCVDQHFLVLQCARITRHVASHNNHTVS